MTKTLATFLIFCASLAQAQLLEALLRGPENVEDADKKTIQELTVSGDYLSASRSTGELVASGGVKAVASPYRFQADRISRSADGRYEFGGHTLMTTCTNDDSCLHWSLSGDFTYRERHSVTVKDAWVRMWDLPVLWVPYWYYPLNTDYGFRFMPGYTSRWGGYILTGYVYDLINEGKPDSASLGGSTYADFRTKNGFALGQTIRWNLKDLGVGKIKAYNAWDMNYDRYEDHWNDRKHRYRNWGSDVDRERYRIMLDHSADFTERDSLRVHATYLSDSWVQRDFFEKDERDESIPSNEAAYEHRENSWAAGGSVSGPINDFYGGTARLPEGWLAISPQPIWELPVNYESQTRAGYLNRDYARYPGAADPMFRYVPYIGPDGRGADYQAFRADTAHRVSAPFKLLDVLAVVPRATYRGSYWSDSGAMRELRIEEDGRSVASGDAIYRNIAEFGFTASARGTGQIGERWHHVVEPYLDYSYQAVETSGGNSRRPYIFDNYDGATEWLDQFGFEGRGLPYNWHGVRPGIRNFFRLADENGVSRTVLDTDLYAAVPFENYSRYGRGEGVWRGYPKDKDDPHYSKTGDVVPGARVRLNPTKRTSFGTRVEYDTDDEKVAYADVSFKHLVTRDFDWYVSYIGRDHRIWDYAPSPYERWNWEYSNLIKVGFEHQACDHFAWAPYIRYDCRMNELDEVGSWFDLMTDCLGFRFLTAFEDTYKRVDGSKRRADVRVGFFIYLRALGPSTMLDLARF